MPLDLNSWEAYTMGAMQDPLGVCHLCQMAGFIRYCPKCEHWFCKKCRTRFFWRGIEALKQMVSGRQENCCGPFEDEEL